VNTIDNTSLPLIEILSEEAIESFLPLAKLCQESYQRPQVPLSKTKDFFLTITTNPNIGIVHVCRNSSEILGFTFAYIGWSTALAEKIFVLNDLFVAPEHRKVGVATALLDNLVAYSRLRKINWIQWVVEPTNYTAQSLYDKLTSKRKDWVRYTLDVTTYKIPTS
jgi:ribosomal protein S18 acetylase RimI-like enzyme